MPNVAARPAYASAILPPQLSSAGENKSNALLMASDLAALATAAIIAIFAWHHFNIALSRWQYLRYVLPFSAWVFVLLGLGGLYPSLVRSPIEELQKLIGATSTAFLLAISVTYFSKESVRYSRPVVFLTYALSIVLLLVFRALVRSHFSKKDWWGVPAVVVGKGMHAIQLSELIEAKASMGIRVVAALDDRPADDQEQLPLYPVEAMDSMKCFGCAIIMMHGFNSHEFQRISATAGQQFRRLIIIPDIADIGSLWVTPRAFGALLGLEVNQNLQRPWPIAVKRLFDVFVTSTLLLLAAPLLLMIYLAVRLTSSGPGLYSHERIGKDGGSFSALKFRTMYSDAEQRFLKALDDPQLLSEWQRVQKLKNDPRVTPVGRWLRKSSLDELPQLWNVLTGEMSLVGPRPIVTNETLKYGKTYESYKLVRPGLTGFWQISGRNDTTYEKRVSCDEYYIRNWSIWFDIYILLRTIRTVLLAEGAY